MEDLDRLLKLNLEIDGALRSYAARKNEDAKNLLIEKFQLFSNLMNEMILPTASSGPSTDISISDESVRMISTEDSTHETDPQSTTPLQPEVSGETYVEVKAEDSEEENGVEILPEGTEEVIEVDTKEQEPETLIEVIVQNGEEQPHISDPADEHKEEKDSKDNVEILVHTEDNLEDAPVISIPKESPAHTMTETTVSAAPYSPKNMRVEDMISSSISHDLLKSFNLNDKFRFVRNIFNNNNEDFLSTVNKISAMESLSDVYDYLLNDRAFDIDNEEVKDFISIVSNHFNEL